MNMKFLDKWALKRAEKINQREAEKLRVVQQLKSEYESHRKFFEREIRNRIQSMMEVYEKVPEHIKVGDRAIMNYYSIKYPGRNGWDGGVFSLLNHIPKEEMTSPVTVIIKEIYVDTSLSDDLIDKFFEYHSDQWLYENAPIEKAWNFYLFWLKGRSNVGGLNDYELIGLYKTAMFDCDGSFKPKWGLNIHSFHSEGTTEYHKTYEVWAREIEINIKRSEYNVKLKELNEEKKKIDEEYRGMKILERGIKIP